jgi:hypothetical protein
MALQFFCWPLGRFFSCLILYTVDRTPWMGDQPVAMPLPTHRPTQSQNKHTEIFMPLSGILAHNPSVRASEDGSCLRTRSHCVWRFIFHHHIFQALVYYTSNLRRACLNIVTDLFKAFLGNASVNTFPRLRNNRRRVVFSVPSLALLCLAEPHRALLRDSCIHTERMQEQH